MASLYLGWRQLKLRSALRFEFNFLFGQRGPGLPPPTKLLTTFRKVIKKTIFKKRKAASARFCGVTHFNQNIWKLVGDACETVQACVCVHVCLGDSSLLLIDGHKEKVFGKNVHIARPRPHSLVPRVAIAKKYRKAHFYFFILNITLQQL